MDIARQMQEWKNFWSRTTDPVAVEAQLRKLHWLEDFAFHCGSAIGVEQYRALQIQIETGEKKLAELHGDVPVIPNLQRTEQPEWVSR
jgi:hypothetical protein